MKKKKESEGSMLDANLSIKQAREYLVLNGIDWSASYVRLKVALGSIPSIKIFSSRVIPRAELDKIIIDHRNKKDGLA